MDFMNRGFRNSQPTNQTSDHAGGAAATTAHRGKNAGKFSGGNLGKLGKLAFLVLIVVLIVASYVLLVFKDNSGESKLVDKNKYQAVFLNGGQVYFGKIGELNNKYLDVSTVYYLRVNQQVQPNQSQSSNQNNDISLVKLGCELHGPTDQMIINRDQVVFWENLKDDGQVAKAIAQYKEKYPNGQSCQDQAASQNSNTNTNTTPAPKSGN